MGKMVITNIYCITSLAVIGGGLFGFDIASMSAIISTEQYLCYFDQSDGLCRGPTPNVQGGITAAMAGGSWLGSLTSGLLSDRFGRKKAIIVGALFWLLGSAIVSASQSIAMLVVGRILNGISVGICSAQVPVYISEAAQPAIRGRLIALQEWAITWGILIMFYMSYGFSFVQGPKAFRLPWGLQAIPGVILVIGMCFMPESPRWYAQQDRWTECHETLALLHGKGDKNSPLVQQELAEIRSAARFEREHSETTYLDLFKPNMIWRTHTGVFVHIWQQLCGINVMMYYITYVFKMANLTGNILLVSSSISNVINVIMVVPAIIWADRWGRRRSLIVGGILMGICLYACGIILAVRGRYAGPDGVDNTPAASTLVTGASSRAVIALSMIFVGVFAATWGPATWTYPPELFPLHLRGRAVAFSASANWAANFALGYFVPPAFVNIRWGTYILFGTFCAILTAHAFLAFPETAGKPLEEIENMFNDPTGVKYIGTPAWKTSVRSSERIFDADDVESSGKDDGSTFQSRGAEVQKTPETTTNNIHPGEDEK